MRRRLWLSVRQARKTERRSVQGEIKADQTNKKDKDGLAEC